MVAKIEGSTTVYYHQDGLSARVTSDSSGNKAGEQGHFPYGESWYASSTTTKWQFTSYERDGESGNDYAMARYDVNRLGRFASPDPIAGSRSNPQSLNRYAYVENNPANLVDPSGLIPCNEDDPSCGGPGDCGYLGCLGPCDFGLCGNPGAQPPPEPPLPPSQVPPPDPMPPSGDPSSGDPWILGCETFGIPCGMQFPVGGGIGFPGGCTYGSGDCGGWAMGWTKDANGNVLGDYANERLCGIFISDDSCGGWLFWNVSSKKWTPNQTPVLSAAPHLYASPSFDNCSPYRNGTGAGDILFGICSKTPDGPWSNCVRGNLLGQYDPHDNPAHETLIYGLFDHARYFASCRME